MESDIVHRLLHWAYTICTFNKAQVARDAAAEIQRLRAELDAMRQQRDEARRDACVNMAMLRLRDMYGDDFVTREDALQMAKEIAAERGWDCFGEKEGGGA